MIANTNGGHEAGFILNSSVGATPGMNNTYLGYKRVAAGIQMANQYTIDRSNFMDNYQAKFGHLNGAEQLFDKLNPPQAYAQKAIAMSSIPKQPSAVPQGSAYSLSRGMWRAPNGAVYDASGRQVQ